MTPAAALNPAPTQLHAWVPVFWEPVSGTGERLMVGVVHAFQGEVAATRLLRDDVLDALYGNAAAGAQRLIETGLTLLQAAARAAGVHALSGEVMGLHIGPLRQTGARSVAELLRTAALLYSSLANLDRIDGDEVEAPQQEEVSKRFSTEVREQVLRQRPDLDKGFGQGGVLVPGGQRVRFGYFSPRAVLHFCVLSAGRPGAGIREARAKLFELQRAREVAAISTAALIAAVPPDDDPTLGTKQREAIRANRAEIEREADACQLRWHAAQSVVQAAGTVIDLVTA